MRGKRLNVLFVQPTLMRLDRNKRSAIIRVSSRLGETGVPSQRADDRTRVYDHQLLSQNGNEAQRRELSRFRHASTYAPRPGGDGIKRGSRAGRCSYLTPRLARNKEIFP